MNTYRKQNTTCEGQPWSEQTKKANWEKGTIINGYSPNEWRYDKCGNIMQWADHGNRESRYGWEIDHINPVSNGGTDDPANLQPLHCKNNTHKGNSLTWKCPHPKLSQ